MVRKCNRGIADIAVMEVAQVGVRTRARAALAVASTSSGAVKRKKVKAGELVKFPSCYVEHKSRRRVGIESDNLKIPSMAESNTERTKETEEEEEEEEEKECSIPSSDHVQVSCCSSNGSSELVEDNRIKFVDLEVAN